MGHVITTEGITPDPDKIKAILEWPIPTNQTKVRAFLGTTAYNRRYIKSYAAIAEPLTNLTGNEPFTWTQQANDAFQNLKLALSTPPVLAYPDFTKTFEIECDASSIGVGTVLKQ